MLTSDKTFDLSIAGELNLDLILYGLPLDMQPERELLATDFVSTLGSSSAIVAHNAAALGLRVQFTTLAGDDAFGRMALDRLREAGVELSESIIDPALRTGVTVLLPHGGVRHSLTFLGAITALRCSQLRPAAMRQARHLHLCSLYLQTGLHDGLSDLVRDLKRTGTTISLDTNDDPANRWGEPLQQLLPLLDIFMPNEDELRRMAGCDETERAMAHFAPAVPLMVVKRGRRGCSLRMSGSIVHVAGVPVEPVDTIGAGDSFDAGFLTAFLKGLEPVACARAGNISGALSTQGAGGTEAFRDVDLRQRFLRQHGFPM